MFTILCTKTEGLKHADPLHFVNSLFTCLNVYNIRTPCGLSNFLRDKMKCMLLAGFSWPGLLRGLTSHVTIRMM